MTEIASGTVRPDVATDAIVGYDRIAPQITLLGDQSTGHVTETVHSLADIKSWGARFPALFREVALLSSQIGIGRDEVGANDLRRSSIDRHRIHIPHPEEGRDIILERAGGIYEVTAYEDNPDPEGDPLRLLQVVMPAYNMSRTLATNANMLAIRGRGEEREEFHPAAEGKENDEKEAVGYALAVRDIAHMLGEALPSPQKVRAAKREAEMNKSTSDESIEDELRRMLDQDQ